jgi:hypothetical protein
MHYVTIGRVQGSDAELWWENRAGMKWKLTATPDRKLLTVDPSSYVTKYYNSTTVKVVWNGTQVTGLVGANDELYARESG